MADTADLSRHMRQMLSPYRSLRERVIALRPSIEYRQLLTADERNAASILCYRAYRAANAIPVHTGGKLRDPYDDAPNVAVFGLYFEDCLCASVRLHIVRRRGNASPAFATFADQLIPLLDAGETFIDTNCFCVDPDLSGTVPELAYLNFRLPVMAADIGLGSLVTATVRERHIGFYRRIMRGHVAAPPRPYPGRLKPFALVLVDFKAERDAILGRHPFFTPAPGEAEALGMNRIGILPARARSTIAA